MIVVIRIKGRVGLSYRINETLDRLRLKKKYACVVLKGTPEEMGMVEKLRDFVAYGEIRDDVYKELVKIRGRKGQDGKLKPFFRLHPPRKGYEATKTSFKEGGSLGNREDINELVFKMI